jgi:hypothetical protein
MSIAENATNYFSNSMLLTVNQSSSKMEGMKRKLKNFLYLRVMCNLMTRHRRLKNKFDTSQ